jgi:hypothetical protein
MLGPTWRLSLYGAISMAALTSLGERPEPATIAMNLGPEEYEATGRYSPAYSQAFTAFFTNTGTLFEVAASRAPVLAMTGPVPHSSSRGARGFKSVFT